MCGEGAGPCSQPYPNGLQHILENQVGVGSNILVRVNGNKGGGSNAGVDGVSHKAL
jgi:hypothetical protein